MKVHTLAASGGQRTIAIVFDTGDEPMQGLLSVAQEQGITAGSLTAIGAFERATVGFFDVRQLDYRRIKYDEQMEVLSLTGNIAMTDEGPKVHAHVVLGRADGTAHGGHLLEARVRPTLEVVLVESPAHLRRRVDRETGLPLIDLPKS